MTAELLSVDMFSDKVGQPFLIEEPDLPAIALTLTEVTPIRNYANAPREPFSLTFTSQGIGVLPQRTYALRHVAFGLLAFFLVPVAENDGVVSYQSIFN